MSTKKKKKTKSVRDLSRHDKINIMQRVAAHESVREIAKDYGIRYPSIRHVVMSEWKASFPDHFRAHAFPKTITKFKLTPPKFTQKL